MMHCVVGQAFFVWRRSARRPWPVSRLHAPLITGKVNGYLKRSILRGLRPI